MLEKLTEKQNEFILDVIDEGTSRINILEGSVRSGKTFVSLIAWVLMIAQYPKDSQFFNGRENNHELKAKLSCIA